MTKYVTSINIFKIRNKLDLSKKTSFKKRNALKKILGHLSFYFGCFFNVRAANSNTGYENEKIVLNQVLNSKSINCSNISLKELSEEMYEFLDIDKSFQFTEELDIDESNKEKSNPTKEDSNPDGSDKDDSDKDDSDKDDSDKDDSNKDDSDNDNSDPDSSNLNGNNRDEKNTKQNKVGFLPEDNQEGDEYNSGIEKKGIRKKIDNLKNLISSIFRRRKEFEPFLKNIE